MNKFLLTKLLPFLTVVGLPALLYAGIAVAFHLDEQGCYARGGVQRQHVDRGGYVTSYCSRS